MKNLIPWRKKDQLMELGREADNPFELLHRRMNELFEGFLQDFETPRWPGLWQADREPTAVSPRFDVAETDDAVKVSAELPGLDEKDVEVTLDENYLTVKGEKKQEREEKKKNYYLSERSYGQFQRVLPLPAGTETSKAKAQFKNGVLTITLPKTEQAKVERKRIPISSE